MNASSSRARSRARASSATTDFGRSTAPGTLADGDRQVVVEVEANAAALEAYVNGSLPQTGRLAIQTEGRSAIEAHLDDRTLPKHLKITAGGVRKHK